MSDTVSVWPFQQVGGRLNVTMDPSNALICIVQLYLIDLQEFAAFIQVSHSSTSD